MLIWLSDDIIVNFDWHNDRVESNANYHTLVDVCVYKPLENFSASIKHFAHVLHLYHILQWEPDKPDKIIIPCLPLPLHPFLSVSSRHYHEEGFQEFHYSGPAAVRPHVAAHPTAGDLPDLRAATAPQHPHALQVWIESNIFRCLGDFVSKAALRKTFLELCLEV